MDLPKVEDAVNIGQETWCITGTEVSIRVQKLHERFCVRVEMPRLYYKNCSRPEADPGP